MNQQKNNGKADQQNGKTPGMTDGKVNLVDSIQAEIAPEISPLLKFIVKYGRKIGLVFLLFILAAGGVGIWETFSSGRDQKAQIVLGKVLAVSDPAARLKGLEELLPSAGSDMKIAVLLPIAETALALKDYPKAAAAWQEVSGLAEEPFKSVALWGYGSALALSGKEAEALPVFEKLAQNTGNMPATRLMSNLRVAGLAESLGQLDKSIAVYEGLLADPDFAGNKADLEQRINYLRQQAKK